MIPGLGNVPIHFSEMGGLGSARVYLEVNGKVQESRSTIGSLLPRE